MTTSSNSQSKWDTMFQKNIEKMLVQFLYQDTIAYAYLHTKNIQPWFQHDLREFGRPCTRVPGYSSLQVEVGPEIFWRFFKYE